MMIAKVEPNQKKKKITGHRVLVSLPFSNAFYKMTEDAQAKEYVLLNDFDETFKRRN